jgi:hypothetical protein
LIGWFKKALFEIRVNPFNVWFLNYPEGWNLAATEIAPAQLLIALPFSLIGGETFGYNMAMLISFILAGMLMTAWVHHLTKSITAGVVAGTIYACLPYWQMHFLAGHLNLCGTQWIPLFFRGWFDLLRPEQDTQPKRSAFFAALGLGLTALTSQYYFFMMVFTAALIGLIFCLSQRYRLLQKRIFWIGLLRFVILAIPLVVLAEIPFLMLAGQGGMPDRSWYSASMYSAGLTDFFLPATNHFLWKDLVGQHFNRDLWIEATLYVGIFALALAVYGFIRRNNSQKTLWTILLTGTICALILAFGTDLHWNGEQVRVQLPAFLQTQFGADKTPVPLPGLLLFKYFPFFAKQRALMRFGLFALLFVACGAGIGYNRLIENRSPQLVKVVFLIVTGLLVLDFFPSLQKPMAIVQPRAVDEWLATQPADGALMRLPFELNDDQYGTYLTLYNEKPFIGGFFNAFPPSQYLHIRDTMSGFPSQESLKLAEKLNVTYIELETAEMIRSNSAMQPEEIEKRLEAFNLGKIYQDEEVIVYEIP